MGLWTVLGQGPLITDDPSFPDTAGDGYGHVQGRVSDLVYVRDLHRVYAAAAQGGVWESDDMAGSWRSVGDGLPIGSVGAVGWTSAGGGTLLAATGDNAFSNSYSGAGTYWSADDGLHWHRSRGAPDGALAFRLAIDPTDPRVVFLATGLGLYRSTDAGRSFNNVNLPVGSCAGQPQAQGCFFASVVTDVAVQHPDDRGHQGGAVVAAIGWRAGAAPNAKGRPQAPSNGLYRSATGAPGTFVKVPDAAGFAPSATVGRVALGVTAGTGQDSSYLYAVVQDATLERADAPSDIPGIGTPSALKGVYVSPDFGRSWRLMESRQQFYDPTNGSSLSQKEATGGGPGYQAAFNEVISPDPSQHDSLGAPTRVLLGLEEVWVSSTAGLAQDGLTRFEAIGPYNAYGSICLLVRTVCSTVQRLAPQHTPHPDQHAIAWVPDDQDGVRVLVGNDGGVYSQHAARGGDLTASGWDSGDNTGMNTLEAYSVAIARDGVAYAGLQDSGEALIRRDGSQRSVLHGDVVSTAVDPSNSKVAYAEQPPGRVDVTTDGGATWTAIDPGLRSPGFASPFVMDHLDAAHLLAAGRDVAESIDGPQTKTWAHVFDLGTAAHPADAMAVAGPSDPAAVATAADVRGAVAYVGYCATCDPIRDNQSLRSGIATNIAGPAPPSRGHTDGWHLAQARGLPQRLITSVLIDPHQPRTVYVTLGSAAARYFAPLGALEEPIARLSSGHLYRSEDAGEHFRDVSGDLPDVQATSIVIRQGRLLVGTALGEYASVTHQPGRFVQLVGLPPVAISAATTVPGDGRRLAVATFGRGLWTYRFTPRGR